MEREKVTFRGAQETMLATLYGRALDSRSPRPILHDTEAEGWLGEVPADRPAVAVFEGLTMYLRKQDGRRLIERITGRFPGGQLLFDCYGTLGVRMQKLVPAVRNAGAVLHWGIDDPHEIEGWHEGLECLDALRSVDMPGLDELPLSGRLGMKVLARIPGLRDVGRIMRYRF
ncbi:hypothetical protein [Planomonospora parontospora]|uniref:hypothetical protein n=1 Tax=Planomonospora parontospora TaxID=58119 RepID=UPI00166F6AED|nr:hypothetical protein [Planomonospora parontospora]GGL41746.1 hypothetical protein GCM10014719_48800 [Planomonospora parontospora subsp. antibiotica]GII18285.1 hypothetical protein Ppa05_50110 [Planomonospora parontospora subsp. antibiotica]